MRRVEAEGDSRGHQSRNVGSGRPGGRANLRRLALEGLERRELLSTIPTPLQASLTTIGGGGTASSSAPSVAVDPVNPDKLVAAWTNQDPADPFDGQGQVTTYVRGAYSVDGGTSWVPLPGSTAADIQKNFAIAPAAGVPQPNFAQTTDATVAFGRDESVYMVSSTHSADNGAGVINLQRWDFTAGTPVAQNFTDVDTRRGGDTVKPVYSWVADAAINPVVAVDNNVTRFVDGTSTQSDPFVGTVYIAWQTNDAFPANPATPNNPNLIKMVASSDHGQNYTHMTALQTPSTANNTGTAPNYTSDRFDSPQIAISQGSAGVPGGQVTVVYENSGQGTANKPYTDTIVTQFVRDGGVDQHFGTVQNVLIPIPNPGKGQNSAPDQASFTVIPFNVNITDSTFTLQNLDLAASLRFPDLSVTNATLTAPASAGGSVRLWNNATDSAGTATNASNTLGGNSVGIALDGQNIGIDFDSDMPRTVSSAASPYIGHFNAAGGSFALNQFRGLTPSQLNGTWTLTIIAFRNQTLSATSPPLTVNSAALDLTSGMRPGYTSAAQSSTGVATNSAERRVANSYLNSGSQPYTNGIQPLAIKPAPSIASDNTLGAFSPHQGRLYIAYTDDNIDTGNTYTDATYIRLSFSDDGGQSWLFGGIVNDDNGQTDGYSEGGYSGTGSFGGAKLNVRPKLEPKVAVDQYTGTLIVSFLDTRNDASRLRVSTYIAASIDGGSTFAPETYANASQTAVNAITGQVVNLGPIPDNESSGNGNREAVFGFGRSQGLAVADGHIVPVWSSNQNRGDTSQNIKVNLSIAGAVMTFAAGPRVLSSTMGPVGQPGDSVNGTRAADGSPIANTIILTFDRAIDPASFQGDGTAATGNPIGSGDVRVFFQDPYSTITSTDPATVKAPVATVSKGTITRTFVVSGHAGEPLLDGQLNISLANFTNLGSVLVQLVSPNGQIFTLTTTGGANQSGSYRLPAALIGQKVDGTYALRITDNSPSGQTGSLTGASLQLNGLSTGLRVTKVTPIASSTTAYGATQFQITFDPTDPNTLLPTGVGTYSYVIRPNVSDRLRSFSSPIVGAQTVISVANPNTTSADNFLTSTINVAAPANRFLDDVTSGFISGTVTANITLTPIIPGPGPTPVSDVSTLTVFLVTPDGERYVLVAAGRPSGNPVSTLNVNATFTVPSRYVTAGGIYTLEIEDTQAQDTITLTGWTLDLNTRTITQTMPSPTVTEAAQPNQVPIALSGGTTKTSLLALVGHPGLTIASGTLKVSAVNSTAASLTYRLLVGGTTYLLGNTTGSITSNTFTLPAGLIGKVIDGQYQLQVTDNTTGDVGSVTAWSISLVPQGLNGNAMDQNADGTAGQDPEVLVYSGFSPGDDFAAPTPAPTTATIYSGAAFPIGPYNQATQPLIVPGPHIISTTVTGVNGATTGSSADNLINNDKVNTVQVTYDRNIQVSSFDPTQVLNIIGPAGPISGPQTFTSTAVAKTFTSKDIVNKVLPVGVPTLSLLPISGTGVKVSNLTVKVNITDPNDAGLTLTLISPTGISVPLVSSLTNNGANFIDTVFSDATPANGLIRPIAGGTAPFSLTYAPASPLSALTGLALDGVWTLKITNAANGAVGKLNSWSLSVTPQVPTGPNTFLDSAQTISNPDKSFTIDHLAVKLNITSPVDSNLAVYLIAPDGTFIPLIAFVPGVNFLNTTLDDGATIGIGDPSAVSPFSGIYIPSHPVGFQTLTSLRGRAIDGTWTVRIADPTSGAPAATLNSWSLIATPQIKVTPLSVYTSTDTTTETYPSTDASQQVYQGSMGGSDSLAIPTNGTLTTTITFPSTPSKPFTISDLEVALNILPTANTGVVHDNSLSATLTAPDGTIIPLFANVGGNSNLGFGATSEGFFSTGQAYTILGDSGTLPISLGTPPFVSGVLPYDGFGPIFRPSGSLSALAGKTLDGNGGTWTLSITNSSSANFALNGWALIATPQPGSNLQPAEPIPAYNVDSTIPLNSTINFPSTDNTYTIKNLSVTLNITATDLTTIGAILVDPTGVQQFLFFGNLTAAQASGQTPIVVPGVVNKVLDGDWKLLVYNFDQTASDALAVLNGWSINVAPNLTAGGQAEEPIPDTSASVLRSSIVIPDDVPISKLQLQLNIKQPLDSDLTAFLIGPDGTTTIRLFANLGGSGANFTNTLFSDLAPNSIDSASAPFSGSFKPEQAFSTFGGGSIKGTWTLVIQDANANGQQGVLVGWSLINASPLPGNVSRTFAISFPTQQLSGTYAVTVGTGIVATSPDPTNPNLGAAVDTNLNAGLDSVTGRAAATTSATYNAVSVPVAIPKGSSASIPGTLTSQLVVPDSFVILPDANASGLAGLTVHLDIAYANDPDLTVTLISPNNVSIVLFKTVGQQGTANFTNTTLSDNVNPLAPITVATAPFNGAFNPSESLDKLAGANSQGTWSLQISNAGTRFTGTLLDWSLTFQRALPSSGLGEPVADRDTVNFRLFNLAPGNVLANSTWTAVGPTGVTGPVLTSSANGTSSSGSTTFAGAVSSVAFDPSDPTDNTAFVTSASGGVWKTTNFLTTNPSGPTYLPLTDFGPGFAINIGSIAVFGRNGDPTKSIVFAGTGFGPGSNDFNGLAGQGTYPNANGNSASGVGIIRSMDGGQTWTLLDSTKNTDDSGNILPVNSTDRDHKFVGDTTYKLVVDPKASPSGGVIVYAALGGPTGGLWRSIDGGNHWTQLSSSLLGNTAATDVLLDPASVDIATKNLDIVYAAFQGVGVYISSNQGLSLSLMAGLNGADNLIQNDQFAPAVPLKVPVTGPNGNLGRIVLAKPVLTSDRVQNLLYQDWLYVAVENPNGTFAGLYVTKDRGENWTKAQIQTLPTPAAASYVTLAEPTNDNTQGNYDVTSNAVRTSTNGNYVLSLTVDPLNPNIVYLGGTTDFQTSGLIRVDLTGLYDAHSFVPYDSSRKDGGALALQTSGRINVVNPKLGSPIYEGSFSTGGFFFNSSYYLDLRHAPNDGSTGGSPFDVNATLYVFNSSQFTNDGTGVKWTPFDAALQGSTNLHQIYSVVDPLTGKTRLIYADDQGVFTGLYNADGSQASGIGSLGSAFGSRNGNLQNEQFFYGAAQPSNLAAQAAGALFYGSGQTSTSVQSDPNLLGDGNLTWTAAASLSYGFGSSITRTVYDTQDAIRSADRGGVGIATDPTGSGTIYEYDVPGYGGNSTDFLRVNHIGQTTGLVNNYPVEYPFNNTRYTSGQVPLGNFVVNPLSGQQILISSALGTLYETVNQGIQWLPIGQSSDFGGGGGNSYAPALAFGAPDASDSTNLHLNQFIYVGTVGGGIFATTTGGAPFTNISTGLDGSSILAIYPSPNRGSHEAYAVTVNGVFYTANSLGGGTVWNNITGNLKQIQTNPYNDPTLATALLSGFNAANQQYGGFRSIVADYRYEIPDVTDTTLTHPVLYVGGYGGVFRSLDNGQTWTAYPNTAIDGSPVDGGYLPNVQVSSLSLNLGVINPATGHPSEVSANAIDNPEVLLATTFGRGDFAIRLAPYVFTSTIALDPTKPVPGGSNTGAAFGFPGVTSIATPFISGISEITNYGNIVTINLYDDRDPNHLILLASGQTDDTGHFSIRLVNDGVTDPSFFTDSTSATDFKTVGVQATESSGATGNIATFSYLLESTAPPQPINLVLDPASDTGRLQTNGYNTNLSSSQALPGQKLDFKNAAPQFDFSTPNGANSLISTASVTLYRSDSAAGPYTAVATLPGNTSGSQNYTITDAILYASIKNGTPLTATYYYYVTQTDQVGLESANPSTNIIRVNVNTVPPTPLAKPALQAASNSGLDKSQLVTNVVNPVFDVTDVQDISPGNLIFLYRSSQGSTPIIVGRAPLGATSVMDRLGAHTDGLYVYSIVQSDIYGNVSNYSPSITVTINTAQPATPTISLLAADNSGLPLHPNFTNVRSPRFTGTAPSGLPLVIYAITPNNPLGIGQAMTTPVQGSYQAQIAGPIADGTYTLVARTTNAAGTTSDSAPLTITIKGTAPQIVPTLSIYPTDDTGIKGDGVTSNHRPQFSGVTDKGQIVTLYSIQPNGQLSNAQAITTASTIDGSFRFSLPFNLTDGSTQLVAQTSDIEGNKGPFSSVFNVRIISVAGDYYNTGKAQFTVFRPTASSANSNDAETYVVKGAGQATVDVTPGRDIPIQVDLDGDGRNDLVAYRFNSSEYYGTQTTLGPIDYAFGAGNVSLPVPGYYGGYGTLVYADYRPNTGTWIVALPNSPGLSVKFGVAGVDIPTPAAFNGSGQTEIATFRPTAVNGNDADTFNVIGPNGNYQVNFARFPGFSYKAGDIPAPADYDGLGRDEFALYRPSTGQFFIINTPYSYDPTTWTYRTVTLNLPGGPNVNDVPASLDYDGDGKIDPTVFRPSNSTFYELPSLSKNQVAVPFGVPGLDIAAAGPLLYRLTALKGAYATTDGYPSGPGAVGAGIVASSGGLAAAPQLQAQSITASASNDSTQASLLASTTIAVASPTPILATPAPAVAVQATPATVQAIPVTVGSRTPKVKITTAHHKAETKDVKGAPHKAAHAKVTHKVVAAVAHKPTVDIQAHQAPKSKPTAAQHHDAVAAALKHIGKVKKNGQVG